MPTSAVQISNLDYAWPGEAPLLSIERFEIGQGESVYLRGPSGSGKSTLLGLITGVLSPNGGELHVLGAPMHELGAAARDAVRAERLGVIFQLFNLVPYLTPIENVWLPCEFSAARRKAAADTNPRDMLARLGLTDDIMAKPSINLSVGQQQRVAAARALIGHPGLVIADEPTSALDADAQGIFIDLLKSQCADTGAALLFVSHDQSLSTHFDRAVNLTDINSAGASP